MSFGFPAYHRKEISHAFDLAEAKNRTMQAASILGWQLQQEPNEDLVFRSGCNLRSWGEVVKIHFQPHRVVVHSQCRLITQCFDWGRNRSNCAEMAKAYTS